MNHGTRRLRTVAVGALASITAVAGLVPLASGASGTAAFTLTRLAGTDRYETAQAIATATFPNGAETVLIATGENFPDALAGSFLAGNRTAPILLTRTASVPAATKTALSTLKTKNVIILGGTDAVSAAVQTDLADDTSTATGGGNLTVTRIGGANRYETARLIATATGTTVGTVGTAKTALVARGDQFPDALAGGPLAYNNKLPILLTPGAPTTTLHTEARSALTSLGIQNVLILGGVNAISAETETAIKGAATPAITTDRLLGIDRTETARDIAEYALASLGFVNTHMNLARGDLFPDALTGGPHAGNEKAPILLTVSPTVLSNSATTGARRFLTDHASTLTSGHVYGGTAAVSDAVVAEAQVAGGGSGTPGTGAVTLQSTQGAPGGTVTGNVTNPSTVTSLTVSGCGITTAQNVTVNAQTGAFSFTIPSGQAAGACPLTFTITRTGGATETATVNFTVSGTTTTGRTVRPELVSAAIVSTTSSTAGTPTLPSGTRVRYTFDENVVNPAANPTRFHVYTFNGQQITPAAGTVQLDPANSRAVLVDFTATATAVPGPLPDLTTAGGAGQLTVATVDAAAVTDLEGDTNPEGDAALGTAGSAPFAAGTTSAPDLRTVAATRQGAAANQTAVDFTFDEVAHVQITTGFHLVLTDVGVPAQGTGATVVNCTATNVAGTASGGTQAGGTGTTTITAICTNPAFITTFIPLAQIARGYVDAGAVSTAAAAGTTNALQATDTPDVASNSPDLVSATLQPSAQTGDPDRVLYTFDEPITVVTQASFCVYTSAGGIQNCANTGATRSTVNAAQVSATFAAGTLSNVVGANVLAGAVTGQNTANPNRADEVGTTPPTASLTPGRTTGPDLTAVALQVATTSPFTGQPLTWRAVYTFDEEVTAGGIVPANFKLWVASGTTAGNPNPLITGTCVLGTAATPAATTSQVVCTVFTGNAVTPQNVGTAVLGTVDNAAVVDASGVANPEGAEATTGGTGSPSA